LIRLAGNIKSNKTHAEYLHYLLLAGVIIITFIIYSGTLKNDFITKWDDNVYVTGNPNIKLTAKNIETSFFHGESHGMYLPLTSLSFSMNYYFGEFNPYSYHFVNILLHIATIILVFWFISMLCGSSLVGLVTASLFAVHTMQVESVAFAAGRRDILYTIFFILSCVYYLKYINQSNVHSPQTTVKGKNLKFYLLSLGFFVLSLLSKGQAASLPVTLILLDFFRGKKLLTRRSILEKSPFFILAIIFGIIAFAVKNATPEYKVTLELIEYFPIHTRLILACYGILIYLTKLIIPFNLSVIYPYPINSGDTLPAEFYIYPLLIIALIFLIYYLMKKGNKTYTFGFLFFICNIFLVLQIAPNSYGIINEHYVYLPCAGIFFMYASGYNWVVRNIKSMKVPITSLLVIYLLFLGISSYSRSKVWKDSITLFSDVIDKYPTESLALNNLGNAKWEAGDKQGAMKYYDKAIESSPKFAKAYNNRGIIKSELGDNPGALVDFNKAIELDAQLADAFCNRGLVKINLNDNNSAMDDLNKAIILDPESANAYTNRGWLKTLSSNYKSAIEDYDKALYLSPNSARTYANRGWVKSLLSDYKNAIDDYDKAIALNAALDLAYINRGIAKYRLGDKPEAINDFTKALEINPANGMAYLNRGMARYDLEDRQGACLDWKLAGETGNKDADEMIRKYCRN